MSCATTQVQILNLTKLVLQRASMQPFLDHLRQHERHCLRQTRKKLRRFRTARLRNLVERCATHLRRRRQAGLGTQDAQAIQQAVAEAFAEVLRRQARIDPADTDSIHRTRIAFKKYRYLVEALAPCLAKTTPGRLQAMHGHQTMMGEIQDLEVLLSNLDLFLRQQPSGNRRTRLMRSELERRHRTLIRNYLATATHLRRFRMTTLIPVAGTGRKTPRSL